MRGVCVTVARLISAIARNNYGIRTIRWHPRGHPTVIIAMATATSPADDDDSSDYYDVLMLGRTGQGKSTTGNKLLLTDTVSRSLLQSHQLETNGEGEEFEASVTFKTGGGAESVTSHCQLISNEMTMIRVLDTPGFADSKKTMEIGVFKGNLHTFRAILHAQSQHDLAFCRVLYFLPLRGPPERADGILQEELKLMYGFLGEEVFKIMAIVATNRKKKSGKQEDFDAEDIKTTELVFMTALEKVTGEKSLLERCPPVLYLPFLERDVITKVVGAPVLYEKPLVGPVVVEFQDAKATKFLIQSAMLRNEGRKLQFRDRCTKCSSKLIYEDTSRGRRAVRVVLNEGTDSELEVPYNDSKCHPVLIPEHYTVTKVIGGIAHVATLGIFAAIGKIRGKKLWPGFTNHDEYCAGCGGPPSAEGCDKVGKSFELVTKKGNVTYGIAHSSILDKLHLDE